MCAGILSVYIYILTVILIRKSEYRRTIEKEGDAAARFKAIGINSDIQIFADIAFWPQSLYFILKFFHSEPLSSFSTIILPLFLLVIPIVAGNIGIWSEVGKYLAIAGVVGVILTGGRKEKNINP